MTRTIPRLLLAAVLLLFVASQAFAQAQLDEEFGEETNEGAPPAVDTSLPDGSLPQGEVVNDGSMTESDVDFQRAVVNAGVEKYVVQPGDTLWDITTRVLGSPWYWQKVWAMNQHITNPHWIEVGDVVYFQSAGPVGTMVGMEMSGEMEGEAVGAEQMDEIPEVMDTNEWRGVTEGGDYQIESYMTKIQSNAFNFYNFRRDGFIARNELRQAGKIANSPSEHEYLVVYDNIYIEPEDVNQFNIGQTYQIFRNMGEVEHPVTGKDIGYKIRVLGKCVVKRITKGVVTAQILESYDPIVRGDLVRPWKNPVKDIRPRRNKVTLQGYVVDALFEALVLGEHQILFVDKGISDGVEEGNRFFVVRRFDGMGYDDGLDNDELPYEKIAELIVLSSGSKTCVALVTRSLLPINNGDKVVMEKNY